jgi:preprotein translocase subunit YajC
MSIANVEPGTWTLELMGVVALGAPQQGGQQSLLGAAIPILLMLGIFYFLVIMPMKKKQQKVQAFQSGLKAGEKVILSGGIYGTLTRVDDGKPSVQVQIANNVRIEVAKAGIIGYQGQEPVVAEPNQS